MGREIRRVPLDWKHPENEAGNHLPLFDITYEDKRDEWLAGFEAWQDGTHKDLKDDPGLKEKHDYWEWNGNPPDRDCCRPKFTSDPVGYQVYETVSEGTPVSPVFKIKKELKAWLRAQGYSEKASDAFIENEWAVSMVYTPKTGMISGIEAYDID